ncbi:secretion protein HlyD [Vibrio albus]|uniref:Secretion protein HlyD n=1 Tax=Vibrio albus TaxID=2200953 RepID=A0A2U3BBD4_9VIBR|nr:secretion protein HlyD [Vibrio albus]PWI34034.1 secretion protein HlyD [Vibrio albus]
MKKQSIIIVLVVGMVLGVAFYVWDRPDSLSVIANNEQNTTVFGNVDIRQVNLGFRVAGRVKQLYFDEGDEVRAGELIAVLDSEPFEEEMALHESELSAAEADYERLQSGFRQQEIKVARAAVSERQATLNNLQAEFIRRQKLVNEGNVSRQSFDDIRAQRDAARAGLESAREQLALMEEGYRKEEVAKANAQVGVRMAQLEIARTRLNDTNLYAPSSGTLLTRALEPGSVAGVGQTVVTLSLSDPVWVRAYISESGLGTIAPGMNAEVFTDSNHDQPYKGHIGFISPKAEFTPKNIETPDLRTRLVFRFRVLVDNPDNRLRQGMPVTVKLLPQKSVGGKLDGQVAK